MDPEELLSMYDASSGSMMLMPEEADSRLDLADAVPVMASRASTRFFSRFISSPKAMSPKRRPRRRSRLSRRPSSHFHQLQQEQKLKGDSSLPISA